MGFGTGAAVTNALLTPEAINALTHAVDAVENEIKSSEQKARPIVEEKVVVVGNGGVGRPCVTITGKIVAVGTYAFVRMDTVPGSKPHFPIVGTHYHYRQANQDPASGKCFWNGDHVFGQPMSGALPYLEEFA